MKKIALCLSLVLAASIARSQISSASILKTYGLPVAFDKREGQVIALANHPASLALLEKPSLAFYGERKYFLNDLSCYHLLAGIPFKSGNFGLEISHAGNSLLGESNIGLAYARKLSDKVAIGTLFNYHGKKISGYGNASVLGFSVATLIHMTEKITVAIQTANPIGQKFGIEKSEVLPSRHSMGIGFSASTKFSLAAEIVKESDQQLNVNIGMCYHFMKQFYLNSGVSTTTSAGWLGIGYSFGGLRLDIISGYHPQLGFSPAILFVIQKKSSAE